MNAQFYKVASILLFLFFAGFSAHAQNIYGGLELKLQYIGSDTWGVYANPNTDILSSTITGSGQVTVVMPNGFQWSELQSQSGLWMNNISISDPPENPSVQYISFGLVQAEPSYPIIYSYGEETLLFTFVGEGDCPEFMSLIDCGTPNGSDPFCPPNSFLSNPGNDLSVIEFGGLPKYYNFENIYAPSAWDCHDNDGDGYANSIEDRNGSGDFDQEDLSDLNDFKSLPLGNGIKIKLQLIEENKWGVFATPHNVTIDSATITGSGQVTVVMPNGYDWSGLIPVSGLWQNDATVFGPTENPSVQYVSFGLVLAEPNFPIVYHNNEETLLFTFEGNANCPDSIYLVDCGTPFQSDPFCPQNSVSSNPGNDLSVIEFNTLPKFYNYVGNYAPSAWSCHDNDSDGIANALEDTNGNGMYDVGIDVSDLNTAACNIAINDQPLDVVNCVNAEALFLSTVSNPSDPAGLITQYQWQIQLPNSSVWENASNGNAFNGINIMGGANSDTFLITPLTGLHGAKVRMLAWTGLCDTVVSETANILVEGSIVFSSQPENIFTCAVQNICFAAQVENTNGVGFISYQWEFSFDGLVWNPLTNTNLYSGIYTPELCFSSSDYLNGVMFRLKAKTGACEWNYSDMAQLSVESPASISEQPKDVFACVDKAVSFHAEAVSTNAGNLNFQWQVSDDNLSWMDIDTGSDNGVYSGFGTTTLSISNSAGLYDKTYRMAVWTDLCDRVYTDPVRIELAGQIEILSQPENVAQCAAGEEFCFAVGINHFSFYTNYQDFIHYRWQGSIDGGGTWFNLANGWVSSEFYAGLGGVHSDTLCVLNSHNIIDHLFRVKIWSQDCDTIFSDAVGVVTQFDYAITSSPEDVDLCSGEPVEFSIEMEDNSLGISNPDNLHVQWQESADNGLTYSDLFDGSNFGNVEGANTTTLQVTDADGRTGHRFRAKVWADECNEVYSDYAVMFVSPSNDLTVNQQPISVEVCEDDEAVFIVDIASLTDPSGANLNYQWEILLPGSNGWQDVSNWNSSINIFGGINSNTLLITPLTGLDGAQVRVRAWTDLCNQVVSAAASIMLAGPIVITGQPQNTVVCAGESACFDVSAIGNAGESITYSWQYSLDNGASWLTTANGNSNTFCVDNVSSLGGMLLRVEINGGICGAVFSEIAMLQLEEPISISQHPVSANICPGNPHTFHAIISSSNNSVLVYQWQMRTNGTLWTDISEGQITAMGGKYTGVKTKSLHINLVDGLDGQQFRLRSSAGQCSATTDAATLTLGSDPNCEPTVSYVTLGLRLMPNRTTWGVYLKPKDGFVPSGNNKLTGAEVTIAASQGFSYKNLYSQAGGTWKPTYVLANTPDQSGLSFFTFELTPNNNSLNLTEDGVLLFSFAKNGDCPDAIMLMENDVPLGLHPNHIAGTELGIDPNESFFFGGYHYYNNKPCKEPIDWETPNDNGGDSLQNNVVQYVQQGSGGIDMAGNETYMSETAEYYSVRVYPNPASEMVNIHPNQPISERAVIRLVSLQGQTLRTQLLENTAKFDLADLASGMYFILLEIDGIVVQQEKLVKK